MRRVLLMLIAVLCVSTGYAVTVYQNDYEGETVGAGSGGWNWGNDITTHSSVFADYDGSIVVEHTGTVTNDTGAAADARFGSKWDITLTGNTSADPADYTISFDLRNISGDWDPIEEGIAIVTNNSEVGGDQYGHGFAPTSLAQADGWVHVEFNLADWSNNWWQGDQWDLTQSAWSIEIGQPWPGVSVEDGVTFTQVWLMDNLKVVMGSETEPFDPAVLPLNTDGTSGTLVPGSQTDVTVTLNCKAAGDPNALHDPPYPMNPDVLGHYIYVSNGSETDPNVYLLDYVEHVHHADPYLTDPNVWYGPVTLLQGTDYSWQVEEAMDDGTGAPYGAGDPNNILGPVWGFTTIAATPEILTDPLNTLADSSGNASFTVTATTSATEFRWFIEGDSNPLSGGIYSGEETATLTITGATAGDEGLYYCIPYNGDPDVGGIAGDPSASAKLWYPRLVSHYPFEAVDGSNVTPDIVDGFDAVLSQDSESAGMPILNDTDAIVGTYCLQLDNADHDTDPNVQFAAIAAGVIDYEDMTISLWIQPTTSLGWSRAFDFGNGTDDYIFVTPEAGNDWGVLRFAAKVGGGDEIDLTGDGLAVGQWYHVAVTITGDTGRLYRNGELVSTNTEMTTDPIDLGAVLNYIGKSQYDGDPGFDGLIDDLKIYNYALTTYDVAQEYLVVQGGSVCDRENTDLGDYDSNDDCKLTIVDFSAFAARWLEDDRIYPAP